MNFRWIYLALGFLLVQTSYLMAQYVPEDTVKRDTIRVPPPARTENRESKGGFDTEKLVPGGNFSLSLGNPYYIDISPALGYRLTDDLVAGLGITYIAAGGTVNNFKYRVNYYGGRVFGRQRILESVFANAELDFLNVPYFLASGNTQTELRKWLVSPLVGASYILPMGRRGGIMISLLYNLNYQQQYSPYNSALIYRMGFFL